MNIHEFKQLLGAADAANDSTIVESLHGVGKSDSIHQFAKDNEYHCEDLFLSMFDTGDLCGIPRATTLHGLSTTVWSAPDWFSRIVDMAFPEECSPNDLIASDPKFAEYLSSTCSGSVLPREHINSIYSEYYGLNPSTLNILLKDSTIYYADAKRSVLFLDEINRSALDVRQAALQLVLNKELHSHKLPYINGKCTLIVAAINPSDIYQVDELDSALLDRFIHVDLKVDAKEWLKWAKTANVNPIVCDYIAEHPSHLHTGESGATPRSWAKLAAYVDAFENTPKEIHYPIMKGKLGAEIAGQFLSFYNNYAKVIKMDDIEAVVAKGLLKSKNPEVIAKAVAKLIANQEAIQKSEFADNLYAKYITNRTSEEALTAMPLMAFLYALEIENLASFLKATKASDYVNYMKLAEFDGALNDKKLFRRITSKLDK